MKGNLESAICAIHPVPEDIMEQFLASWHLASCPKKTVLTEINSVDKFLYFITAGVQKAYYVSEDKEFIVAFNYPYNFSCVPDSFITQTPSNFCYECITPSEFYRISQDDFFRLVDEHHEIETFLRKSLTNILVGVSNRYQRLLTYSMEERFTQFMKTSPHLINLISQKDIANYLKMDPTNFSKLINAIKP